MTDNYTPSTETSFVPLVAGRESLKARMEIRDKQGRIYGLGDPTFKEASFDLKFADRKDLVDDITGENLIDFSRSSVGTYVDSDGLIKSSYVNKFTHSTDFTDSSWIKGNLTAWTSNTTISPDGKLNGFLIQDGDTSNSSRSIYQNNYLPSDNGIVTISIYAKAAGHNHVGAKIYKDFNNHVTYIFNLTGSGSITAVGMYVKVGNLVNISVRFTPSGASTNAHQFGMYLPFKAGTTESSGSYNSWIGGVSFSTAQGTGLHRHFRIGGDENFGETKVQSANSISNTTGNGETGNFSYDMSITYRTID